MASIVLSTLGPAIGAATGVPFAGQLGGMIGSIASARAGGNTRREYEGARLETLAVQTSTYGRMIPITFGAVRISGNVIWSLPIRELATTTEVNSGGKGGGGGGGSTSTSTSYSYSITLAIAVCEGEVTRIDRVWADSRLLDLSQGTYRIYTGGEAQLPDPMIESYEGVGATPAYRGLAYVVIEDFPLGDFGNRIPNFTFEVTRRMSQKDAEEDSVESLVTSVMLIPGSGEFVYDAQTQYKVDGGGYQTVINQHTPQGKANVEVALDQLQETFPNLEWVGLAVNWFGTGMDIADCEIWPCVEYQAAGATTPDSWGVAGFTRGTARQIGADAGVLRYGGTPDDGSIVRLLDALAAREIKVFFYPQMLMDIEGKPWRGYLGGDAGDVSDFFSRTRGYNAFILHYANLVAGKVDAFAIGTELCDVTKISATPGVFPAVEEFVSLAEAVQDVFAPYAGTRPVLLTYAADWSEYHHTDGGWHHLDALWASDAIDMVGIDAYFPLTDAAQAGYDIEAIREGWTSGEGYEWYYTDAERTTKADLSPEYAWKNIAWWWSNTHTNPDSSTTDWVPESKPVWFTEYGFASVDGCANQPNVFIDSTTEGSAYPRFSRGRVDFMAQRAAITATELAWADSGVVAQKFLWTWDARPYPYWPDLREVWADGGSWVTGHWVQGKLGASHVAAVVERLMLRAGLAAEQIDTRAVQAVLDGFVLHERVSARAAIGQLMRAFFFDLRESASQLVLVPRQSEVAVEVAAAQCVPVREKDQAIAYTLERAEDLVLPQRLEVQFLNRLESYETAVQSAARGTQEATDVVAVALSIVLSQAHARAVAEAQLLQRWAERTSVSLQLPMAYAALEPGDVLELVDGGISHRVRLTKVQVGKPGIVRLSGVVDAAQVWDGYISPVEGSDGGSVRPNPATRIEVLDIPAMPGDAQDALTLRFAACGVADGWSGATILRLLESGVDRRLLEINTPAVMGTAVTALGDAACGEFDRAHTVDVVITGTATLAGAEERDVLNGLNVAVLGQEIIQFATATLVSPGVYRLGTLLRGRLGTEGATVTHAIGERFVLLNEAVVALAIPTANAGQAWHLRASSFGDPLAQGVETEITIAGNSLKPYSPVHVRAVRDVDGDVTIRWVRRTRLDGGLRDFIDVPLREAREHYEIILYDGITELRRWRPSSPSVVYSAAEQVADFGGAPTELNVTVCQFSELVGPGVVMSVTVSVEER